MPRKKVGFSYGNLLLFQTNNFKNRCFWSGQGVVQIKPNWYGVYPMCVESKTNRIFALACLGEEFVFQPEISTYSHIIRFFYFQKYRNFIWSRSCSNQTKLGMENPLCN